MSRRTATAMPPVPTVLPVEPIPDFLTVGHKKHFLNGVKVRTQPTHYISTMRSVTALKIRSPQAVKEERRAVAQAAAPTVQEAIAAGAHTMEALRKALPDMDETAIALGIELLKARKRTAALGAPRAASNTPKPTAQKPTGLGVPKTIQGSKLLTIKELLTRPQGCTRPDVLAATGWKAVSMQQQAKACGLKLRQEKEAGKPTSYFGS